MKSAEADFVPLQARIHSPDLTPNVEVLRWEAFRPVSAFADTSLSLFPIAPFITVWY